MLNHHLQGGENGRDRGEQDHDDNGILVLDNEREWAKVL